MAELVMKTRRDQQGIALIIIAFILALAATAYVVKTLSIANQKASQNEKTMQSLNAAKQALIAWSVSNSKYPGQMPFPDRGTGGGYDGYSDCLPPNYTSVTQPFVYSALLGQLPVYGQSNPCISPQVGLGDDFKDAYGNRLLYAVSRNLMHMYENYNDVLGANNVNREPVINPNIINAPPRPWLKVVDASGNLISDKVAAVIFAPQASLSGQNRSNTALASEFLDAVKIGATTYNNADYLQADASFIIGQDSNTVSDTDMRFAKPYQFNDKLVYITINELMTALNNRAASEISRYLNQYKAKALQFPYAAPLGSVAGNKIAAGTSQKGFVPVDGTDVCTCESQLKCSCSFAAISKVTLKRGDNNAWTGRTGACSHYSENCNCTGAGSCTKGAESFVCDAFGVCTHNVGGSNTFTFTVPDYANIKKLAVNGCAAPTSSAISCTDAGKFAVGLDIPAWFSDSLWADFLYYEWSNTNNIKVGERVGVSALLVATGAPNTSELGRVQSRPSINILDYLDSGENTNGDQVFDKTTKPKTANYNDQPFIVAP